MSDEIIICIQCNNRARVKRDSDTCGPCRKDNVKSNYDKLVEQSEFQVERLKEIQAKESIRMVEMHYRMINNLKRDNRRLEKQVKNLKQMVVDLIGKNEQ